MSIFNPDTPHRVLHLVSCVSIKRVQNDPLPAHDLYCSQWFKLVRKIMKQRGEPWGILSAYYGLIDHDAMIFAYDQTLNELGREERLAWATDKVLFFMPRAWRYVIWAGERYYEFLAPALKAELPLRGLGIGQQLGQLTKWANGAPWQLATDVKVCDSVEGGSHAQEVADMPAKKGETCGSDTIPQADTGPRDG